jgi:hypothetical protein
MEERGEHLKIFDIKHNKAPTLAEITLTLTSNTKDNSNSTVNMVDGFLIESKPKMISESINLIFDLVTC